MRTGRRCPLQVMPPTVATDWSPGASMIAAVGQAHRLHLGTANDGLSLQWWRVALSTGLQTAIAWRHWRRAIAPEESLPG